MNKHYNKTIFQGKHIKSSKQYFEGWYYKQVNKDSSYSISFIPGISYNKKDPHSFIQCIIVNGEDEIFTYYNRYSLSDFEYTDIPFTIKIKNNIFSKDSIILNIENEELTIFGELEYSSSIELRKSFKEPNIMGYLSYLPKLQCNHHIISVSHKVNGNLLVNKKLYNFTNGKGYIEKDWGTSFPKDYIWLQCNNFNYSKDIYLTFSYATIPYFNIDFKGFFCSLVIGDKEYRFASYNNSKVKLISLDDNYFNVFIKRKNIELNIKASIKSSKATKALASPYKGEMSKQIKEGLKGIVEMSLLDKDNNFKIDAKGSDSGIEIMMK